MTISGCNFRYNECTGSGGAIKSDNNAPGRPSTCTLTNCMLVHNTAAATYMGGGLQIVASNQPNDWTITNCTFAENSAPQGSAIYAVSSPGLSVDLTIDKTIIAYGQDGLPVECGDGVDVSVSCTDVWENAGGDWSGCIEPFAETNFNLWEDPVFCCPPVDDYRIRSDSPLKDTEDCATIGGGVAKFCSCQGGRDFASTDDTGSGPFGLIVVNPASRRLLVTLELAEPAHTIIQLFDVAGRSLGTLQESNLDAGAHAFEWGLDRLPGEARTDGMGFLRVRAGAHQETRTVLLMPR